MTDSNFSAIRGRLRYQTIDEFVDGYARFIRRGGMFIPMTAEKLKPVGSTVRFQFLLEDGSVAMLGEGVVRQTFGQTESGPSNGILLQFTRLSAETKSLVARVLDQREPSPESGAKEVVDLRPAAGAEPSPEGHEDLFDSSSSLVEAADDASTHEADVIAEHHHNAQDTTAQYDSMETRAERQTEDQSTFTFDEAEEQGTPALKTADEPPDPAAQTSAGPRQLGRTEAGLQILAFDDASEEDAEEFAKFALGGDEDDVDQMFAGIFGGDDREGDLFGGGDREDDLFGGGDREDDLFGGDDSEDDLLGGGDQPDPQRADDDAEAVRIVDEDYTDPEFELPAHAAEFAEDRDSAPNEPLAAAADPLSDLLPEPDPTSEESSPLLDTIDGTDETSPGDDPLTFLQDDDFEQSRQEDEDLSGLFHEDEAVEAAVEHPEPSIDTQEEPASERHATSDEPFGLASSEEDDHAQDHEGGHVDREQDVFSDTEDLFGDPASWFEDEETQGLSTPDSSPGSDSGAAFEVSDDLDEPVSEEVPDLFDAASFQVDSAHEAHSEPPPAVHEGEEYGPEEWALAEDGEDRGLPDDRMPPVPERSPDTALSDFEPHEGIWGRGDQGVGENLQAQLEPHAAPSEELQHLLGSLEESEVSEADIELQHISDEDPAILEEEDDEESLESLLAAANEEIEALRREEAASAEDLLDDLLGDDLPPPPAQEAQFTMPLPEEAPKKKKQGFISKLFGKD